ncbi:dTDP-4-dehydrorhamnose reductase [Desulfofustis limnaeus]|jgi:dTDP-4-dehydrorhamnose reductase|uniref:dTDP-4-dehydrorhamnose reductase n=1 Tax=Desulfofustis limnaeus TaxID=2740163 RepID=A0ABN6M9L7_9BACT|nr:dTDP-4-dehydrorhamnose reductase [Desulfofustis limnaeus]MDX9895706.1 dTDP-4-dehydrorhamnose reductase [Desulfofustis sp.]BDD88476.1 NAD(P)-dependent oxidoreductase [Desulfofustis limnaeus]
MKILIIGSGGQLGTDCNVILSGNHTIIASDYPAVDIGSRDSVQAALSDARPDAVINCAAFTAVDRCESEREAAWRINADGPRHLADCAAAQQCRLIHISTDYVFDGRKTPPEAYEESDAVNPLSEYGRSKLAGEQAVLERCPEALILRTAWLYSAHGANFLKTILRLALSDATRPFTIVNDQFGSLTWSHTLARQIEKLLETSVSGVVHATADGFCTWYEGACYFLEKMAVPHSFVPCTTEQYPTPAHRPANSILRNRVLDDLGLSVFGSWQKDVDHLVDTCRTKLLAEAQAALAR